MKTQSLTLVYVLIVVSLLLSLFSFGAIANLIISTSDDKVDLTEQNSKIVGLKYAIDSLTEEVRNNQEEDISNEYTLTKSEFEDKSSEDKALELALESVSLENRDFLKAVYTALEDFGENIDDKDDVYFLKYKAEVDGDEVDFESVKVYYFIDGDDEEQYKARLEDFTIEITDLDFDDNFKDAEVDEDYLDNLAVLKVYEQ